MRATVFGLLGGIVLATLSTSALADGAPRPDALLMVDQHREAIVERVVKAWPEALTAEQADALRQTLAGLRTDRLLAISISPGLESLLGVLSGVDRAVAAKGSLAASKALGDAAADLVYTPLTPCRLFDTRVSQGGLGTPTPGVRRTYGAITPVANQGGPGGCAAVSGAAVALIQIGTLTPSGNGLLQGGPQGAASFPNALILYQPGDQYGTAVAMPLNLANGEFDLVQQFAQADLYGDLLGYFKPPGDGTILDITVGGQRVVRYWRNPQSPSIVGGHPSNVVNGAGGTIAGGGIEGNNCYEPSTGTNTRLCANFAGNFGFVGAGWSNSASTFGTVGGGEGNTAQQFHSAVTGGKENTAYGAYSAIAGGYRNAATGASSAIVGGGSNTASGNSSTVAGGHGNIASGNSSFAAGSNARTQTLDDPPIAHSGVFIWADTYPNIFNSIQDNEFAARATGGVRFVTGLNWTCGVSGGAGGSWGCTSDRDAKTDLIPLDGIATLERLAALPVYQWVAKDDPRRTPHAGPTAQDFMAAFGLGDNDKMIGFADAQGVAFAAIQGLNAKLAQKDRKIAELKRAVEVLLTRASPEGRVAQTR